MTTDDLLEKLKIKVRDLNNLNWTEDEMKEAIENALIDPAFCDLVQDTLTINTATQDYTVPETIDVIEDIYFSSDGEKIRVPNRNWNQVNNILRFTNTPTIDGTCTLIGYKRNYEEIPKEKSKLALYLAIVELYEMVEHEFAGGILMADITSAEILNIITSFDNKASKERSKLVDINSRRDYSI